MKPALVLSIFLAVLLADILPIHADATNVTITKNVPIETLGSDGSVTGVAVATVGNHYSLVKYEAVGPKGTPVVILENGQNQQYLIDVSATDYNPLPAAQAPIPTANAPTGGLSLGDLPPAVQTTVQSKLDGKTVGHIDRVDDDGDISYDIETRTTDGKAQGLSVAQDGTLLSTETTLADVPAAVQAAIRTTVGEGKLDGVDQIVEDGETTYSAGITVNGQEHDFTFDEEGTLTRAEIDLAALPPAVQLAVKGAIGQGKLEEIDKTIENGETAYSAEIATNGQEHEFIFKEDGTLSSQEVDLRDLPTEIQTAVNAAAGHGKVEGIDKSIDEDETTYVATISLNGQDHNFTFQEDGTLISQEVKLSDLPPAVQATISGALGPGKLKGIDQGTEDGATTYTATVDTNGKDHDLTFGADGTLLSKELKLEETPPAVQATITSTLGDGKVTQIDLSFEGGRRHYEIEGQKGGQDISFTVGPKGKFLGMDE